MLYRPLEPKQKYDRYFEKTGCNQKVLGYGYTDFGIKQMKQWATKYAYQTKQIAKVLQAGSLFKTLENVHQFIYHNFQYKPDYEVQHIQSPACAWQSREDGINCKGYSTIASAILQTFGIRHYIRRVSYDGKEYTHVFVVVPVNKDEVIIDGTIPQFNFTPDYKLKNDIEVMPQKLKYIGLNAPAETGNLKQEFLKQFYAAGVEKGIENIAQIVDFISKIPEKDTFNINVFGVKYGNQFIPFKYKNVDAKLIQTIATQSIAKGLNGFGSSPFGGGYPGGSFGYNFGDISGTGNFGVDLNLGGGGATGSTGGGNGWNTASQIVGFIGDLWETGYNIYNDVTGNNQSSGSGGSNQHTGGTSSGGGYNPYQNYPPQYQGGGNAGNNGNAYQPTQKWYEKPTNIVLGLLGLGVAGYAINKSKSKK